MKYGPVSFKDFKQWQYTQTKRGLCALLLNTLVPYLKMVKQCNEKRKKSCLFEGPPKINICRRFFSPFKKQFFLFSLNFIEFKFLKRTVIYIVYVQYMSEMKIEKAAAVVDILLTVISPMHIFSVLYINYGGTHIQI